MQALNSFDEVIDQIIARQRNPYSFVRQIMAPLAKYYNAKRED